MRIATCGLLCIGLIAGGTGWATAKCDDEAAVAEARATADAECDCAGSDNHGDYVSCVSAVAKDLVDAGLLPANCKGEVTRCAANSICAAVPAHLERAEQLRHVQSSSVRTRLEDCGSGAALAR